MSPRKTYFKTMDKELKIATDLWKKFAPQYFWGDSLDVRFKLFQELKKIKNSRVFDIGCNAGILLSAIDETNKKYGIDINPKTIKIARRLNPGAEFFCDDIFNLVNFQEKDFNIILLAHVLPKDNYQSTHQPVEIIRIAASKLRTGGKLFLTTPNAENSYQKKRGKVIDYDCLKKLLEKDFDYKIYSWNPFPIQAGHILKFIPGIFNILELLMKKEIRKKKCVSFYVKAIKK